MLTEALQRIENAQTKYQEALAEAAGNVQQEIAKAFAEVPEEIVSLAWTQYTPWFNDGEACEFGVNCPYVLTQKLVDDEDLDTSDYWDWLEFYGDWSEDVQYRRVENPDFDPNEPESYRNSKTVSKRFNDVPESEWKITPDAWDAAKPLATFIESSTDLMRAAFGDHVKVTLSRGDNGVVNVTVDEYEHN